MINELRLGPGWLAAFILVTGSLGVGCAEGVTSVAGLFDGGTIDGDGLGTLDSGIGRDAAHDTGGIIIVHGGDTGVPGVDGTTGTCVGGTMCGSTCVNTASSATNCGGCGIVCETGSCSNSVCAGSSSCVAGETMCTSGCTELSTDVNNCGTCGNVCPSGESCAANTCTAASCSGGETSCSGTCTDTTSDSLNCGSCGNACPSGETCSSSSCQSAGDGTGSGTCTHSACEKGAALQIGCDDDEDGIVSAVCECADPSCCTSSWTNACVSYAEDYCDELGCSYDPLCANE